jgi:hypothetical protein
MMKRLYFVLLFLLASPAAFAQSGLAPAVPPTFFTASGVMASGYKLCTTATGTTTPLATYSNLDLAPGNALPNPITLNGAGIPQTGGGASASMYIPLATVYRFTLYRPGTGNLCNNQKVGTLIWQRDGIFLPASGGGTGSPGGISGQIQFNSGGLFGGFTLAGDCTITIPNIVCLKTNGVSFATSATTDTTNASNIVSGTLSISRFPSIGAHTYIGNNTGGSAVAAAISSTQLTADLNLFTSTLQGLVSGSGGGTTNFLRADGSWATPPGPGGGTVTTTGSPASGNLTKFSGATSIVNGDLSGDCTTSGTLAITCTKTNSVSFAASATTDTTVATNITSGTLPAARLPNPSASTLGGVESIAAVTHDFITDINTSGVPHQARPACADLSDGATSCSTDTTNASNITAGTISVRVNPRTNTTASTASLTINSDTTDVYTVTALAANLTINSPSGTPVNGQRLMLRLKDNGTSRTLTFNAIFRASGTLALPTATTTSKTQYNLFVWNSTDSKWDFLSWLDNF